MNPIDCSPLGCIAAVVLASVLSPAWGQMETPPSASPGNRISQVTVYPGSATIERIAPVGAGTTTLQIGCLPASFDPDSLRVEASSGIQVGQISARTLPRNRAAGCAETPLARRIVAIEDQMAAIDAEMAANDLALGYLKGLSTAGLAAAGTARADVGGTTRAVHDAGQPTLLAQHRLVRQKEALQTQLEPLRAERDRLQRPDAQVRVVDIQLAAATRGELRLRYQITGPGWAPTYRATLDTRSGGVRLDRLAQVSQSSGEDWLGVRLRLSTGQPRAAVAGPLPRAWSVGVAAAAPPAGRAYPPPAAAAMSQGMKVGADSDPAFDVSVFQGVFATEYEVPGTVDLASGEQRLTFSLGSQAVAAQMRVRTTPAADATAYVVADIDRPTGVWPAGVLQLYRDGAYAGSTRWTNDGDDGKTTLPFGRDDRILVQAEPDRNRTGTVGFIGSKAERTTSHGYTVQNLHTEPVLLEVLEATPVSRDEAVTVTRRLEPAPATLEWHRQPGVAQWLLTLGAGATARFSADYTVTAPKDTPLSGWR